MLTMVDLDSTLETETPRHYLKEWRLHRRMTGEALAEAMGTDKGTVSKFESGKKRLHEDFIYRASAALGISPDQLFRSPTDPSLDSLIAGVPADLRQHIFTMVAAVAKRS